MGLRKAFAKTVIKVFGWHHEGQVPYDDKFVIIAMPHTSMMDFVMGLVTFWSKDIYPYVFIKKELFFFPMGLLLKALGARPLNRKGATGMIEQVLECFNKEEKFCICITPEGTRKRTTKIKRGFYFIATQANVPIYMGVLDYGKKSLSYGERFVPTGDEEKDFEYIRQYYKAANPVARHPEQFCIDFK